MTQFQSLAWKEWKEVRAFLWIGLGVFLGLPLVGALEALIQSARRFEILAEPWVVALGGVLAVFVAVGATTRDFSGRLPDFWQSRPVAVVRWLLVKYFLGLAVVLAACIVPLCLQKFTARGTDAASYATWFPLMWTAMYSLAFLAGCLVRRMAHAAMLGLTAMLLVYFLPMVLPPLEWMNASGLLDTQSAFDARHIAFLTGMLAISATALSVAVLATRRNWKFDSGPMTMYGSISVTLLIFFSSAAFQLGTNLPVLTQTDLPADEMPSSLFWENGQGALITSRRAGASTYSGWEYFYRKVELPDSQIKLGSPVKLDDYFEYGYGEASPANHPEIRYFIDGANKGAEDSVALGGEVTVKGNVVYSLGIRILGGQTRNSVIPLWEQERKAPWLGRLWRKQDTLYLIGTRLLTIDISDPLSPRLISNTAFTPPDNRYNWYEGHGGADFDLNLPAIPGLSPHDRLAAELEINPFYHGSGDILCERSQNTLFVYRLKSLTGTMAAFEKIGQHESTMLELMFGSYNWRSMSIVKNGRVYELDYPRSELLNAHVSVLDISATGQVRTVGHFAAAGRTVVAVPLPDGRCLVAGSKVWLVGPPPRRDEP